LITTARYAKRPVSMPVEKYRTNIFTEEAASGKKLKLKELVKAKKAKKMKSTHMITNQHSSEVCTVFARICFMAMKLSLCSL
jgi:hypothetical protein